MNASLAIALTRPSALDLAEAEVIRRFKELHGPDFEPGVVWVREAALRLLDESKNPNTPAPSNRNTTSTETP